MNRQPRLRWLDYQSVDEPIEREHIRLAVESIKR